MRTTSNSAARWLGWLVLLAIPGLSAQTADNSPAVLTAVAREAAGFLRELDAAARSCLNEKDKQDEKDEKAEQDATPSCDRFMGLLDGDGLSSYLHQCRRLGEWRDGFVAGNASVSGGDADTSPATVPDGTETQDENRDQSLQLLVDIDYACTTDVMAKRTAAVVPAFNLLRRQSLVSRASTNSTDHRAAQAAFDALEARERRRHLHNIAESQSQVAADTAAFMRRLELELIRSQP